MSFVDFNSDTFCHRKQIFYFQQVIKSQQVQSQSVSACQISRTCTTSKTTDSILRSNGFYLIQCYSIHISTNSLAKRSAGIIFFCFLWHGKISWTGN